MKQVNLPVFLIILLVIIIVISSQFILKEAVSFFLAKAFEGTAHMQSLYLDPAKGIVAKKVYIANSKGLRCSIEKVFINFNSYRFEGVEAEYSDFKSSIGVLKGRSIKDIKKILVKP